MSLIRFAELVSEELADARRNHAPINSAHEGYAVILEELDEFWEECRKKRAERDNSRMLWELIQVAAMAQRTAEDIGLSRALINETELVAVTPSKREESAG